MLSSIRLSLVALAIAGAAVLSGCGASVPIQKMPVEYLPASCQSADIHGAVLQAAQARRWRVVRDEPGAVTLAYPTGKKAQAFEATVRVNYDDKTFRIEYLSSRGLDERQGCNDGTQGYREDIVCAHRNINKWMANLDRDIQRFLTAESQPVSPAKTAP